MGPKVEVIGGPGPSDPQVVQFSDANGIIGSMGPFPGKMAACIAARRAVQATVGWLGSTGPAFCEDDPCQGSAGGYKTDVVLSGREGVP